MARTIIIAPEYFPGLPVAAAMLAAERVVIADTYQYVRQSRQNRAAVRTPDGLQWLTVPLAGGQHGKASREVRIAEDGRWRSRHLKALRFNYGRSPFYEHYAPQIEGVFSAEAASLADLTALATRACVRWLAAGAEVRLASELPSSPNTRDGILDALPSAQLIVSEGQARVDRTWPGRLVTLALTPFEYRQAFDGFEPGMSVLDLLFNHGPEARSLLLRHSHTTEYAP